MVIIDGKYISEQIKKEIAEEVNGLVEGGMRPPHLAAVLVGHDGGSETYVAAKMKSCQACGFKSTLIRFEENIEQDELLRTIEELNGNKEIDGFIVQLPLPHKIDANKIINSICPSKDVDGFNPVNVGKMTVDEPSFLPATPAGILELIRRYHIPTKGKRCIILGRSNIVGKPLAIMLMQKSYPGDCTVTVCHSATTDIKDICKDADIIVAALGSPKFVKADMVKQGAVVIDVGTTRIPDATKKSGFKLTGDVDFENVAPKCSYITPVPGGVGPMTIASLMLNTLKAYKFNLNR